MLMASTKYKESMKKIEVINLNSYERVDVKKIIEGGTTKYHMNGTNNSFFDKIESAYIASPTNTSIIDGFVNYIIGDGLVDVNGNEVTSYISNDDLNSAIHDYKLQGQCALQVVYDYNGNMRRMYQIPVKNFGVNKENYLDDDPEGYWYCADWSNTSKNPVKFIPAFGKGNGKESEILYIKRSCKINPIFALPDWFSGLQYCFMEEEMSNFYLNHIMNSFSVGTIVNINQGSSADEDAMDEAERNIKSKLTGSGGDTVMISYNDNKENATTIEKIEISDSYSKFEFVSKESQQKIMQAHKVNDPSLFSIVSSSGFSSTSDQMVTSLKILYRNQIKPIRATLLDSLQKAFDKANVYGVKFIDFEEFRTPELKQPQEAPVEMSEKKKVELKKWRSNSVSSNVDRMVWNDETLELIVKFNDGSVYTFFNIHQERFIAVSQGYAKCSSSGSNEYGLWWKNKSPSVGAAVHKYLDGMSYAKGGSLR